MGQALSSTVLAEVRVGLLSRGDRFLKINRAAYFFFLNGHPGTEF